MDAIQFEIFITFLMFIFFFTMGYSSDKKSGGFFLMLSGFIFFYLEYILAVNNIMNIYYVVSLMTLFGLYFILLGVFKAFYDEKGME